MRASHLMSYLLIISCSATHDDDDTLKFLIWLIATQKEPGVSYVSNQHLEAYTVTFPLGAWIFHQLDHFVLRFEFKITEYEKFNVRKRMKNKF